MGDVDEQHSGRVRRLDPLLPQRMPLPVAEPDDVELAVPGGAALSRVIRADPATLAATWYPAERHLLIARVGADDPVTAMDTLLARWSEAVLVGAGESGSAAGITWPSRDILLTPTFLAHGLMPTMVLAIRLAGRPSPSGRTDVVVRRATDADLDATVALELELVRWNQMLGQMTVRPNTAELIRAKHTADGRPWSWLAEVDGVPVGLLNVLDPEHAPWASGLTSAGRAVYLSDLMVLPDRRGAGTATALVRHVHTELDRAGFDAVVLHYLAMNPLAAPLWHRCGYRPLLTNWEVRPATRLRSPTHHRMR
jgi:GNAT superfamily N-acetyltransferase